MPSVPSIGKMTSQTGLAGTEDSIQGQHCTSCFLTLICKTFPAGFPVVSPHMLAVKIMFVDRRCCCTFQHPDLGFAVQFCCVISSWKFPETFFRCLTLAQDEALN